MSNEIPHKLHIFQWVAQYIDNKDNQEKLLYQFDENSEYYDKDNLIVPFKKVTIDIFNRENRLTAFHIIPRGKYLDKGTFPRFSVYLTDYTFHVNGQMFKFLPTNIKLINPRLIWFFSVVKVMNENVQINEYIRLYKLGLQVNDENGKNYQKIMIWNADDESITIHDNR